MKLFLSIILLFIRVLVYSQDDIISWNVWDFQNNKPLAYVNNGIRNKAVGTVSNKDGLFKLILNDKVTLKDTVVFSYIGFKTKNYLISELNKIKEPILLQPINMTLNENGSAHSNDMYWTISLFS